MPPNFDWSSYLSGIASGITILGLPIAVWRWWQERLAPRVTVERGVSVADGVRPHDRYHTQGGNRLKKYVVIQLANPSTKQFWFLRGKLEIPGEGYPRWLTIKNEGVPIEPKESTYFQFEEDEVGDLRGATVTIYTRGLEKKYRL